MDTADDLTKKRCKPCEGGMPPATREEAEILLKRVNGWRLSEDAKKITKEFKFKDFAQALSFANSVGAIAEEEGHHPDIFLGWGRARVELATHAVKGLSENDFILAAKIDAL
jgi:4a-hydroxytetrahydrobiopterin dehydratase